MNKRGIAKGESYDVLFSASETMEDPIVVETKEIELYTDSCVFMEEYGQDTDLSEAVEKYLITVCGVNQETIDSIKNIMLEEKGSMSIVGVEQKKLTRR